MEQATALSKVEKMFNNIVWWAFRETDSSTVRHHNITDALIEKYAAMPTFLLNDLNYRSMRIALGATNDMRKLIPQLDALAQPFLEQKQDDYSYWLTEVNHNDIIEILTSINAVHPDLTVIDPKIGNYLKNIRKLAKEGIHNLGDLIKALKAIRDDHALNA